MTNCRLLLSAVLVVFWVEDSLAEVNLSLVPQGVRNEQGTEERWPVVSLLADFGAEKWRVPAHRSELASG